MKAPMWEITAWLSQYTILVNIHTHFKNNHNYFNSAIHGTFGTFTPGNFLFKQDSGTIE